MCNHHEMAMLYGCTEFTCLTCGKDLDADEVYIEQWKATAYEQAEDFIKSSCCNSDAVPRNEA